MAELAWGVNGGVSGVIAQTGATFNAKIDRWHGEFYERQEEVGGFGDGGWDIWVPLTKGGRGTAAGRVIVNESLGVADLSTEGVGVSHHGHGSLTLTAETGKTYAGEARIRTIRVNTPYKGRRPFVFFNFVFTGPITETDPA